MGTKAAAAPQPESETDNPYIGGSASFNDLDDMTPEEQAAYDAEMRGEMEETDDTPEPEPETDPEPEPEPETDPEPEPEPETDPATDQEELDAANPGEDPEPTGDDEGTPEPEVPARDNDEPRVPKGRLDREISKRRELERRISEMESKRRVEESTADDTPITLDDVLDAEAVTRALDMNLDGKNSEAAKILMEQMTNAITAGVTQGRSQMRTEMDARTDAAVNQAVGRVSQQSLQERYDTVVDQVEADYPIFNPESNQFDDELAGRAGSMMRALQADGLSADEALSEAVNLTLTRHRPELLKKDEAPAPEETPAPPSANANKPTPESRKRNAEAAAAQPSREGGRSNTAGDGKVDLDTLTEEEFDALPESTKATLRGDSL